MSDQLKELKQAVERLLAAQEKEGRELKAKADRLLKILLPTSKPQPKD